jgi:hypothetical protein
LKGIIAPPVIGSKEFWALYDLFCSSRDEFKKLPRGEQTETCLKLQEILREGHDEIVRLGRPERAWHHPKAWLVLRNEMILNKDSQVSIHLLAGDVMTREFGWDRDVFITHSPIVKRVSGQFLPQSWPNAEKGLFLPLFEKRVILRAIRTRLQANAFNALAKAEEESRDWGWY